MLLAETTLTVKIGVGASNDPQSRLQNFSMAAETAGKVLAPFANTGAIRIIPNGQEIANTIFTSAGFKDGAERFFQIVPQDPGQQPNPDAMDAQNKARDLEIKAQKNQTDAALKANELQQRGQETALTFNEARQQRLAGLLKESMRSEAEIKKATLDAHHDASMTGRQHAHERNQHADTIHGELLKHVLMPPPPPKLPGEGASAE
jgi:hypothetical protein